MEVPTSKPRASVPQMSMATLESATYRSRTGTVSMWAAHPMPGNAQMPKITHFAPKAKGRTSMLQMAAAGTADEFVPDMQRRSIMNLVLLGGAALPVGWLAGGFIYFFVPPSKGGGGAALAAKDALGDDVKSKAWIQK